jgi:tRNA A-37 threonylcarbamoyl transferase component Bud32/tetratricopeptide (TPR) repeat protein
MAELVKRLTAALADRYAVEREVGRGGMATVFLAEDLKHHRQVAIKVLHPELAAAVGPDRFLREIEIVAGLRHPHILPLYDSGETEGLLYFVMPYVEGESVHQRLEREKQLPLEEALRITQGVAGALDHAHRNGVVHRDIKPANILLDEGRAVVTDFGVARAISGADTDKVTATGMALGTPAYMSPEQAAGEEADARSDIYALGCVLYEMLAGEPPLTGQTPQSTAAKRLTDRPTPLPALRATVSPELDQAVEKALEKAPVDRYATAPEFAEALSSITPGVVGSSPARPARRTAWVGLGTAIVLGVVAVAVWAGLRPPDPERPLDPDAIAVLPFRVTGTTEMLQSVGRYAPELFWIKVTGDYGPRTVDPATVIQLWEAAGGSLETPLAEARALEIAQDVGAGRLVLGVVAGTEANMSLTAALIEVPSGQVRVRQTTVEGPAVGYVALMDELVMLLLAKDWREAVHRLPELSQFEPAAVQAYLAGSAAYGTGDYERSARLLDEALALDSTLVLAAWAKYVLGEEDTEAARFAWERQDRLSPRDRVLLRALMGWRFGATSTVVQRIAQFDSAGLPDWASLNDVGWNLYRFGREAEVQGWRKRLETLLEEEARLRPDLPDTRFKLFDLAADSRDTSAMRRYCDELLRLASSPYTSIAAAGSCLRLATLQGDTVVEQRLWTRIRTLADSVDGGTLAGLGILLVDGRGLRDLDRFVLTVMAGRLDEPIFAFGVIPWARARGRYREWRKFRDAYYGRVPPVTAATRRIRDVLFLGEPEDSSVRAAVAWLDQIADGTIQIAPDANDPAPEVRGPALARCWTTLWHVAQGEVHSARETIRYLREEVPQPYRYSVCAGLIDVLLTEQEEGDLHPSVLRLDSIVRPVPMEGEGPFQIRDGTHFIDNLFLARRLADVGDSVRALAAARRGQSWQAYRIVFSSGTLVDMRREEARLAAAVGDTTGAIEAFEHYFALRDVRPDHPPWAAQWDSMRVEYGTLTGIADP